MVITHYGGEFFKVSVGDTTIAYNPISKDSALKSTKSGADVALLALNHPDFNGVEQVTHGGKAPFVIQGPGEYEVQKVVIRGLPSRSHYGGEDRINTIYLVTLENMELCFLGALGDAKLDPSVLEAIDVIDILFTPIGGNGVLTPSEAHELSVRLEPKVVIPMHYGDIVGKSDESLKTFLKEEGAEGVKPLEKFTVKKKDLEGKSGEVVVLAS